MSLHSPTELLVALHFNPPGAAVLASIDGTHARAKWIPRQYISSLHETDQHTQGTDRDGRPARLALANIVIPEWLAIDRGMV